MTRPHFILFGTVFAALAGTGLYEARLISAQRDQEQALLRRTADLERQVTDLRRQRDTTARDLQLAEQQLTQLPASAAPAADRPRDAEVKAWLARVKQLRQLSAAHPDRQIPEMCLLIDDDWLQVARQASFDTEDQRRQAFASLRTAAKKKFVAQLSAALPKFTKAFDGKLPSSTLDLAPYLKPPADAAMLQRYGMTQTGPVTAANRSAWVMRELAPVDEDYDSRHTVNSGGGSGSSSAPAAWIEDFQPRMSRAFKAYADAHQGAQPSGIAQAVPFITPPFPPATLEKLIKAERDRPR